MVNEPQTSSGRGKKQLSSNLNSAMTTSKIYVFVCRLRFYIGERLLNYILKNIKDVGVWKNLNL